MLILRPVEAVDLDDLLELAAQLDSVNLPRDREFLAERIARSQHSFAAAAGREHGDWRQCAYVFVLEDLAVHRCVGTSLILAKNGRPEAPYYWLEVSSEERYSPELKKRFVHKKLRLRSTVDGPTEVGGLILDAAYRSHPLKCGKALSIVRFAFISAHPERFERQLIAEMLSPFDAPGEFMMVMNGMLSPASGGQMIARLRRLAAEFSELHNDDINLPLGIRRPASIVLALRPWELDAFHALRRRRKAGAAA